MMTRGSPLLSFFFFAKKFCRAVCTRRGTNEVERANILAPGFRRSHEAHAHLLPAFTAAFADDWLMGSRIQLQQRYCSRMFTGFLAPIH